jgi:hypothetical protein
LRKELGFTDNTQLQHYHTGTLNLSCQSDDEYDAQCKQHSTTTNSTIVSATSSIQTTKRRGSRKPTKSIAISDAPKLDEFTTTSIAYESGAGGDSRFSDSNNNSNVDILNMAFQSSHDTQSKLEQASPTINYLTPGSKLVYGQEYTVSQDEMGLTVCQQADQQSIYKEMYAHQQPIAVAEVEVETEDLPENDDNNDEENLNVANRSPQQRTVKIAVFKYYFS